FEALTMVAHHGYGASMGAVYGGLQGANQSTSPVINGMCFGLFVWAMSYCGWLPAMGMDASATREPAQRNALTLLAHLLWGGTTGWLTATGSSSVTNRSRPPRNRLDRRIGLRRR